MIYIDYLRKLRKPFGRYKYHAHLGSSSGYYELRDFVRKLGLNELHIQIRKNKFHYDVLGANNYHKAISLGAVLVARKEFIFWTQ